MEGDTSYISRFILFSFGVAVEEAKNSRLLFKILLLLLDLFVVAINRVIAEIMDDPTNVIDFWTSQF